MRSTQIGAWTLVVAAATLGFTAAPHHRTVPLASAQQSAPEAAMPGVLRLFETYQVVAMHSAHGAKDLDDFILALIRNPALPNAVNDIVVECGNSLYQPVLDRYIAGEDVPLAEARKVWRNTTGLMCGVSGFFAEFFPLVRRINQSLPPAKRLRVIAGDTPIDWDVVRTAPEAARLLPLRDSVTAVLMEKKVLAKHRKALMLFGIAHVVHSLGPDYASMPNAINPGESAVARYERRYPGVTFVIDAAPMHCGGGAVGAMDARLQQGPVPSLVRSKDFAPGSLSARTVDGYLYFGPPQLLLAEPRPADVFADSAYMAELRRRAALRPGPGNDQIDPEKVRVQDANVFLACR